MAERPTKMKTPAKQNSRQVLQKILRISRQKTSLVKQYFEAHRWQRRALVTLGMLLLWIILSYLFFRRFPNNYRDPNFFGEEGYVWAHSIIHHGFWESFFSTFNGYYIWGLYVLEKMAFVINDVFYGGQFANLPRSLALVSYGFLGLMAMLPLLLLRRVIKIPVLLLAIPLILYVPLLGWDYGIIGAIGNYKFVYVYVAFILLIYRHYLPKGSRKFYIVDAFLLLCAYTNVTVYLMLPFATLRYIPDLRGGQFWQKTLGLIRADRSLQSLVVLGILLVPQLYIVKRDGIPEIPGYLDKPYDSNSTAEIFLARSYLYSFVFTFYRHLNDVSVYLISAGLVALGVWFAKPYRKILAFGIATIFTTTSLFVLKRPGLSGFYHSYTDPGPDQFFFTQNWIFVLLGLIVIVELISKLKKVYYRVGIYVLLATCSLFVLAPHSGSFGKNDFEAKDVGNIYAVGQKACATNAQTFDLPIYPSDALRFKDIARKMLCTPAVVNYQPPIVSLGLSPSNNNYVQLAPSQAFTQTFVASSNNLNGVVVYFSTFADKVKSPYSLKLYDASCRQLIISTDIHTKRLVDNAFSNILFPAIAHSAGKTYCFSIVADSASYSPLAVQLGHAGAYPDGSTTLGGKSTTQPVVFALHYK